MKSAALYNQMMLAKKALMMTTIIHLVDEIISDSSVRGGRPVLRGTGFRVADVVIQHVHNGKTAFDIAESFRLDLAQVHAALAYYYRHQDEIDEQIRQDDEEAERLIAEIERRGELKRV